MKKSILILMLLITNSVFAQSILGSYEQKALTAPNQYRNSGKDVSITKDPQLSKKIWVSGLISNQKFYAVLHTRTEDRMLYSVPKQKVGDYEIAIGCINFDNEEDQLSISLNNKQNCFGISQSDYDNPVSVGKGGIKAGGVNIGSNGQIKGAGVEMNKNGVKVNGKGIFAGIQYVGTKN